jgi:hypothetical protein
VLASTVIGRRLDERCKVEDGVMSLNQHGPSVTLNTIKVESAHR